MTKYLMLDELDYEVEKRYEGTTRRTSQETTDLYSRLSSHDTRVSRDDDQRMNKVIIARLRAMGK